jgi:hypothetical protein
MGPSDGYYSSATTGANPNQASVNVPPGDYLANGGCTASQEQTASQSSTVPAFGAAQAFLTTDPAIFTSGPYAPGTTQSIASVPNMGATGPTGSESGSANLTNSSAFQLSNGGTIYEICRQYIGPLDHGSSDEPVSISSPHVAAIRVDRLH